MPYRHAGAALCAVCSDFTVGTTCIRCGKPLCSDHVPAVHRRCDDCEEEYDQLVAATMSEPLYRLALRVLLVVAISMFVVLAGQLRVFCHGGPYLTAAGLIMIGVFIASLLVIYQRRRSLRDRFLSGKV